MPSKDSVKVAVRVRPFNQREKLAKSKCVISMMGQKTVITNPRSGESKTFAFDHSYWSHDSYQENEDGVVVGQSGNFTYANQETVYNDLGRAVLDNAWQGYNAALFAYGQTGSGKSYSMIGYGPNKGIVPILCGELFKAIQANKDVKKQLQVSFSMLEIYNEKVKDLLSKTNKSEIGGLKIREDKKTGFYVQGLMQVPVKNYEEIEKLMERGTVKRTTASTNMNATSSRSHMVITIKFNQIFENDRGQSTTKSSEISLVDLAGSERAASSGATGDRLKEGSAINKSLSTLGDVISALAVGKTLVPYRNSELTKLLRSALGGNSRTIMIAALSPADINYEETLSTLRYADRAKKIQNRAEINENPTDRLIRELKEENARLLKLLGPGKLPDQETDEGSQPRVEELHKLLEENERKVKELELSWEQRLEDARHDWEKSIGLDEEDLWVKQPYITNINQDPMLSGVIKFCFTEKYTVIGLAGSPGIHIELRGVGIQKKHAVVCEESGGFDIHPSSDDCVVAVNGVKVKHKTRLHHLDRLKLGSNNCFLFVGYPSQRQKTDPTYDYDFFQTELAKSEGLTTELTTTDTSHSLAMIFQDYVSLLPQITEANGISEELNKKLHFSLEVKTYSSHNTKDSRKDLMVRVTNKETKQVWIWSKEKFSNRKNMIDEMYLKYLDDQDISVEKKMDPFWDPLEDIFLGSCRVWLDFLTYHLDFDQHLSLNNYQGKEEAVVHIKVVPCLEDGRSIYVDENAVTEPSDLLRKSLHLTVSFGRLIGIRWIEEESARGIYLCARVPGHKESLKSAIVWNQSMVEMKYSKVINIRKVDADFLETLKSDAMVVEIWGVQDDTHVGNRRSSLTPHHINMNTYLNEYNQNKEVGDLLEENDLLRKENSRLKQALEKLDSARGSGKHRILSGEDGRRSSRNVVSRSSPIRSLSPMTSRSQVAGFDAELARGLREFFREVKTLQQNLTKLKEDSAVLQKNKDKNNLKKGLSHCHSNLQTMENDLSTVVMSLKKVVSVAVRKSQQN